MTAEHLRHQIELVELEILMEDRADEVQRLNVRHLRLIEIRDFMF